MVCVARKSSLLFLIALGFIIAVGCGPKIYVNPDFSEISKSQHTVAILPFEVTIEAGKLPKDIDQETIFKMEEDESGVFQKQLYSMFLEKQAKGEYTVEFQDISETNSLLAKSGVDYADLESYGKADLGKILGVDAILSGTIRRSRPMSTGAAIVTGVLFGAMGSTNRVDINVDIHDAGNAKLLWKLDHSVSGSVGSSSEGLAKSLMKKVSKKFPYKRAQ